MNLRTRYADLQIGDYVSREGRHDVLVGKEDDYLYFRRPDEGVDVFNIGGKENDEVDSIRPRSAESLVSSLLESGEGLLYDICIIYEDSFDVHNGIEPYEVVDHLLGCMGGSPTVMEGVPFTISVKFRGDR